MSLYVISYDQHHDKDYTPIWTLLRQWNAKRILESVWLANLQGPAGTIRDLIRAKTNNEDSVVVIELRPGLDWATSPGCYTEGSEWLKQNLGS